MKKVKYLFLMLACTLLASCEKDEIGGTSTEALAGEWYVTVDAVDEAGSTVLEDPFGLSHVKMLTYNTADNVANQLWVNDLSNFWGFCVKAEANVEARTFTTNGAVTNTILTEPEDGSDSYYCTVNIESGKVLEKAATTPSGAAADSIVFYVSFNDDAYPEAYGYAKYKVSGYRYTGLAADD